MGIIPIRNKFRNCAFDSFDLASLTKVIGTTTAVMKLYEQHRLHLSDKVVDYLPEFSGPDLLHTQIKNTITIEDLLTHRSGLQDLIPVDKMTACSLGQR